MAVTLQHLRTTAATKIPTKLAPGQVGFNLANGWIFVGNGGDDILVDSVAVATYSTTATILGIGSVAIPAKPTGGGYEIYQLGGSGGIDSGSTRPTSPKTGDVFVDTSVAGKPAVIVYNGSNWVPPLNPPKVFSLTGPEYTAAAGSGVDAKSLAALTKKLKGAPTFSSGDSLIIGGTIADAGTYIYNGSGWTKSGGSLPDATNRGSAGTAGTKGVVYLARDTDVKPAAVGGATSPDALAVATAAQVKALATLVAGLTTGSTLLGTYIGTGGGSIKSVTAAASGGGRHGFVAAGKIKAGTGVKEGDYFLVITPGTVTGDATPLNHPLHANDHLVYDGAAWHIVASGVVASHAFSINTAADFDTDAVAKVSSANQKGLMVRDGSVATGLDKAWKLVDTIDAGTF